MTLWRRENPESDAHAELTVIDRYVLGQGQARAYPSGAIHSTNQPGKAWVIRVTGTDLDVLPRYRFNRTADKMLETPRVAIARIDAAAPHLACGRCSTTATLTRSNE